MTRAPAILEDELQITMPPMHEGQMEVLQYPARFKVLVAGRRWRKSGFGVVQALSGYDAFLGALTGGQIGWWVPSLTSRYLVADWEPIKGLARQIPGTRIEEANHRALFPNNGSVMMISADKPDSGRGLGLDGAVIDEASLIPDETLWTETIRPALSDKMGWALFLFTPKGLNWCHALFEAAKSLPDWRAWQFPSHTNPYLAASELESMRAEMSTPVYKQEILAEFVTGGAGLFQREWIQYWWADNDDRGQPCYMLGEGTRIPAASCKRFSTVDLAWSLEERADYTVISTWALTPARHLILLDVVRGHIGGPDIVNTFKAVYARLQPGYFAVERTTKQLSIIQEVQRSGLPIREIRAEKDKVARALPATARMEHGQVWFPRPTVAPVMHECEGELLAFPLGQHDDFVDTLAYAALEVARASGGLQTF